ncbi:MAG: ATP-dependent DNA helicase RecG [Thermomicrobiales bacterium]
MAGLRDEWRSGFSGYKLRRNAMPAITRLRERAPTQQAVETLSDIADRIGHYNDLPFDERKIELQAVANALNELRPDFAIADELAAPIGTLPSAISPAAGKTNANSQARVRSPRVIQLPPVAPITDLPGVGKSVADKLDKLHVSTVEDLLNLIPRRHIDYTNTVQIGAALGFGRRGEVTVRGEVTEVKEIHGPGKPRVTLRLDDGTGSVRVTFFNMFIGKQVRAGDEIAVSGQLDYGYGAPSFTAPEWERMGGQSLSTGRLTPVYPLTKGIYQKSIRAFTRSALDATRTTLQDFLPETVRSHAKLPPLVEAYENVHYPSRTESLERAKNRLAFDNLFLLQLGLTRRKRDRQLDGGFAFIVDPPLLDRFFKGLPFHLTYAQRRALGEILNDLKQQKPMARLLQGDVGSGKTVVAASAALVAVSNGFQTAIMAPTEILAEQHFHNFRGLFSHLAPEQQPAVELLTGSAKASDRKRIFQGLTHGAIDVLVGTHALIQDPVDIPRLGFVVLDEQHRFGVRQRGVLAAKANKLQPHILSMTATPIPRTLSLVLHGDLDVSIIDQLPPGRIPIETRRFGNNDRTSAYEIVRDEVAKGRQVFVICPLVEESDVIEAKAAVAEAERLKREVFPDLRIAVLHGRMSGKEKDAIMTAFRDQNFDILVSTSVIEVGIDVPNATVMLVEGSEMFGLAQLHQFRGRVGRGGHKSYCLLLADESSSDGEARLQMMVETNDGFALAEKDLELRGPGDFIGTRQSGLPEMKWLDASFDTRLLDQARRLAEQMLDQDPSLADPAHQPLAARLERFWRQVTADVPLRH